MAANPLPESIQVIAFDAVGTLLQAVPSVTSAYCRLLSEHSGVTPDADRVRSVVHAHLATRSRTGDLTTSEELEREFWYQVISDLTPADTRDRCFDVLFEHFSLPSSWRCYDDVGPVLKEFRDRGLRVVIASNFDRRLRSVCSGLGELTGIADIVISSEVGWRKPAAEFFHAVCDRNDCAAEQVLFVGDDPLNDVWGAMQAGMRAVWLQRSANEGSAELPEQLPRDTMRIQSLEELC